MYKIDVGVIYDGWQQQLLFPFVMRFPVVVSSLKQIFSLVF